MVKLNRFETRHWLLALILGVVGTWSVLPSQSNSSGFQNISKQGNLAWKVVTADHFDIHYAQADPVLAQIVARYAEEALWDHCRMLDYTNRARYAIYLFDSPSDLTQSNMYPNPSPKSGGVTPIRNNATAIVFPGSNDLLRKRVRAEVARLLMEDFYFGGGIQASIQNTVLLHLPEWFGEGFSAYLGEGWGYTDELWMASLEHTNLLDYALEGNAEINRVARKSIWYFIATQYGREKLAEVFYMTRLARSAEDGVVHVLGITLKTLTERWREFILHRITENHGFRETISEQAAKIELGTKGRLLGIALNPTAPMVALSMETDGRHQVYLFDLQKQVLTPTPIKGGWKTDQFKSMDYELPMAWSPDGKQLMTVMLAGKSEALGLWNRESGSLSVMQTNSRLDRILGLNWSNDGRQIVLSALKSGQIDIYRTTPGSNNFVQVTDDLHDDFSPIFSSDDERIYFASTRNTDTLTTKTSLANRGSTDIWEVSLEGLQSRQITQTKWVDEYPVSLISSFEVLVRTNQSGIWNLEKRNLFTGDSLPQTNLTHGIFQVQSNDSLTVFTVAEQGRLTLFQASTSQFLHTVVSLKSQLRLREDKTNYALSQAAIQQIKRDSVLKAKRDNDLNRKTEPDTASAKKVKYYVFDEDSDDQKQRRPNNRTRSTIIRKEAPAKPDFEGISIKGPNRDKAVWAADRVVTKIGYDPIFRLSTLFEARLRDHRGDQSISLGFQPYMDLRSADAYMRYQNNKRKLDYWGGFNYTTRFLNRFDFSTRYNASRIEGGLILPLTRFLSTSLSAHAVYINRSNIEVRLPKTTDGHELLAGIKADIQYDRTEKNGLFIKRGNFAHVSLQDVVSYKGRYNQFATVSWDLRKYVPVNHFVFANRVSGALSVGRNPQKYFVGGTEDWFFGRFTNPADIPIEEGLADYHYMSYGAPIRGFRFNARNGSRFLVYNAELRMPVSRIFKRGLNSDPLYKLEIIPFFDLGTAWTDGNPFSQRNPIDTEVIDSYPVSITVQTLKSPFVMGFGAGTRMQLFGYGVRFDLAWGIEDYTVQKPLLHISLAKNF